MFAARAISAGEAVIWMLGRRIDGPTRESIQIGDGIHVDNNGLVDFTNHACEPTAFVDLSSSEQPCIRVLRDLEVDAEITIDYCATEEAMSTPFECGCGAVCCYGEVRGYRFLTPAQRETLGDRASAFLIALNAR